MTRRIRLTPEAQADIADIIEHSLTRFGLEASRRYNRLIDQAFADLLANPERPGVAALPLSARRYGLYHISRSRRRAPQPTVRQPRHIVVFRADEDFLSIIRILHDRMNLPDHL